ncbi:hypothetical protein Cgig2_029626 [Carnegiea gigantea]|uniref:Caffeic acid O-methyltransferase n=1 Tax=Carnegiea gigantea TaxID=171969 RepID=A0A9Q1KJ22_9CARY|nr:hypothetical protein Cgig2_029626 [Carnegiea gigantea]
MALNAPPPHLNNMMEKEELCSFALSIATNSSLLMVLKAIIELDIIGIINRAGPEAHISPAQIAAQLPTKDPDATASMLDRMLRVLANNSILSCSLRALPNDGPIERLYGLAPICQFFTKPEDFGPMVLLCQDKIYASIWHHLKDAVLDGDSAFKKAHGMTVFEYLGTDMRFSKVFNDAMSNYSTITMKKMLQNYNGFDGLSTLVDVGGGTGQTLNMIIAKYPTIRGVNFDLPHVIKDAPKYDDHGKVIVCDYILAMESENSYSTRVASNLDICMLAYCGGGKDRTEQEFEALAKGAGFQSFRVVCSAYDLKVMEFLKKN